MVWLWLLIAAVVPFCLIVLASFMSHTKENLLSLPLNLQSYQELINPLYLHILQKSISLALLTTFFCLLLGYPFAYLIARIQNTYKNLLILLIIIPFWTSSLIRSYALIAIIKAKGLLNTLLISVGLIEQPINLLFTNTAVLIGLVYNLLPFMILPIMTQVERLDLRLLDAARDLGANSFTTFRRVIIPLTMPGIIAGSILVFLPAMTLFYIADILGGAKSILLGNLIQNQFFIAENWPRGSAISIMLTIILAALIIIYLLVRRDSKRQEWL